MLKETVPSNISLFTPLQVLKQLPEGTPFLIQNLNKAEADKLVFRTFSRNDVSTVHLWVNHPKAIPFWQMSGDVGLLYKAYDDMKLSLNSHSLMGMINERACCQIDIYCCIQDEIALHYPAKSGDYGFHLLMAPTENPIPNLSFQILCLLKSWLFSYACVHRLLAEPDVKNHKAHILLEKTGFKADRTITLSYKQALLYVLPRS